MAAPSVTVVDQIVMDAINKLRAAGHGKKCAIVAEAARCSGLSTPTIYRRIQYAMAATRCRKQRSDRGAVALTRDEAAIICAFMVETTRANGKMLVDLAQAVETLRANGEILAGRVDPETGEFSPLSVSSVNRAMKQYQLHPSQMTQPAPKVELRSDHPNQCWQIDPSLCVLYYLKREQGLRAMPRDQFYKNKPKNLARIEHDRVWRYVNVDHTSSAIYVEYVLGAESSENLVDCFIHAMQPRGESDPFHGVPRMVMVDPGSANTSAPFQNLCAALGTAVWINQPKQPWGKGSVEKGNDLVECKFEHGLKFLRVNSLAELNEAAWRWMRKFNATAIHTRHGMTRYACWMKINAEQLRIAPTEAQCRRLAVSTPEERTVNTYLRVSWRGKQFDVSSVPGVIVGQKLLLARNAWADADSAHVLGTSEEGRPTHYVVPALIRGENGFTQAAVSLGDYRPHADTPADTHRKEIERLAMAASTDAEAAAKRKAKALPFDGRIDPYKTVTDTPDVAYIPRAGTPLDVEIPNVVTRPRDDIASQLTRTVEVTYLDTMTAAMRLRSHVQADGGAWQADYMARLEQRYGGRVPEDELRAIAAWLVAGEGNVARIGGAS